jgi:hypothetical protein
VEAVQDEASPTTLPGESQEAKNLLLGEGQSLLRAHFPKAQESGRRYHVHFYFIFFTLFFLLQ